jgi:hypothetical protein
MNGKECDERAIFMIGRRWPLPDKKSGAFITKI